MSIQSQQFTHTVSTTGRGFYELSTEISSFVQRANIHAGVCNVFIHHTSASLIICENADPQVLRDLECFAQRWVPDGDPVFKHVCEGEDDMPAHVRTVFTQTSLDIPIIKGQCALGTWQGLFLWEHRTHGHSRSVTFTAHGQATG